MSHFSLFTDFDISLFKAGKHFHLYNKLGSHKVVHEGEEGMYFAVWAPNARHVSLIGNFNQWNRESHQMFVRMDGSGIWELFVAGLEKGELYKYAIESHSGYKVEKGDPFAVFWEEPPRTATITWDAAYKWNDAKWMKKRDVAGVEGKPVAVYEVHLGSWRRNVEADNRFLTYRELAEQLPAYCQYMGFTHVELMPVMEHPFYGSWGYQVTGYFAPSSRYGSPQDFKALIDALHQAGIGVILDWVPSHFPTDEHGLAFFDGTHLFEHDDPRKGFHPDWGSYIFNYGRHEVRSFLISNALYWLDQYHIDGLRVDAVASMLYLDYSRKEGAWLPNEHGGRENLEAIHFLREFNDAIHQHHPGTFTIAEESTSWTGVTHATTNGGLGFDMKWMMGWMHDTLQYFRLDSIYRSHHQGTLAFSIYYAFSEKFLLPLSHDEVVYGKGSLIGKMPGDEWQRFANLRLLFAYMYGHPGAKLIFMGGEFAQRREWRHDYSLDWDDNNGPLNQGIQLLVKDLNAIYTTESALFELEFSPQGFEWIDFNDATNSVLCWIRKGKDERQQLIFVANFTPVVRENYRIGVPALGQYNIVLNSDDARYSGSNIISTKELITAPIPKHGRSHSLALTLPPLGVLVLKYVGKDVFI